MLLAMLVNEYIRYMEGIRRYSPRTVTVYSEILEKFTSFAGARDDGTLLESLTPQILRSYEVMLMDSEKLDPRTVNLHLSVLSGFCRYLVREAWRRTQCAWFTVPGSASVFRSFTAANR